MVFVFLIFCFLIGIVCEIKVFKLKLSVILKVNIGIYFLKISCIEVLLLIILFINL